MKVQARYLADFGILGFRAMSRRTYAFEAPEGTRVGDMFSDGDQVVEVIAIGSDYAGPMRRLGVPPQATRTPGEASTPASARSQGVTEEGTR